MFKLWISAVGCAVAGVALVAVGQTITGLILAVVGLGLLVLAFAMRPIMASSRKIAESSGMEVSRLTGAPKMRSSFQRANEQMAAAREQMASLSGIGGGALQHRGTPGTAVVSTARDTGERQNHNPVYEVTLRVAPDGGDAYDATLRSEVNSLAIAHCVPGTSVPVRIDPADPQKLWVNWLAVGGGGG